MKKTRKTKAPTQKLNLAKESVRALTHVVGGMKAACMSCNDSCASVVEGSCNTH